MVFLIQAFLFLAWITAAVSLVTRMSNRNGLGPGDIAMKDLFLPQTA